MTEITTKTCSGCKAEKSAADFYKDKYMLSGLRSNCKVCGALKGVEWAKANPEKVAAIKKTYRNANGEKNAINEKAYKNKNAKNIALASKAWRKANPEKMAAIYMRKTLKRRMNLTDSYIKSLLCSHGKIPYSHIPQAFVELKRTQIQISNFLKEQAK